MPDRSSRGSGSGYPFAIAPSRASENAAPRHDRAVAQHPAARPRRRDALCPRRVELPERREEPVEPEPLRALGDQGLDRDVVELAGEAE